MAEAAITQEEINAVFPKVAQKSEIVCIGIDLSQLRTQKSEFFLVLLFARGGMKPIFFS